MNLSQIKQEAAHRLREDGKQFSKLVLIHAACTAGLSLLLMLLGWLSTYIAPEGGLSNFGTQTLLSTGQTLLQLVSMLIIPFWDAGLIFCALRLLRHRSSSPVTLTEGFRRFGPILTSLILRGLIFFLVTTACSFICSLFLSFLPMPASVVKDLNAFVEAPAFPLSTGVTIFMVIYGVLYCIALCVLLLPKVYQYRLVIYRIMDDEPCGGLKALMDSTMLMRGNRLKLFLLDLRFWWFYLLELGISALSMGDLILTGMGIRLGGLDWIFPYVALMAQVTLYYLAKPKLAATYALFYETVCEESTKEPEAPTPGKLPWKY